MYAITFSIDTNSMPNISLNACDDIRKFMETNNFTWQQGGMYFGNKKATAVSCVLVIQKLAKTYSWFAVCAKDIRMLRIEENISLMPVLISK